MSDVNRIIIILVSIQLSCSDDMCVVCLVISHYLPFMHANDLYVQQSNQKISQQSECAMNTVYKLMYIMSSIDGIRYFHQLDVQIRRYDSCFSCTFMQLHIRLIIQMNHKEPPVYYIQLPQNNLLRTPSQSAFNIITNFVLKCIFQGFQYYIW